ncbi:MAG: SIMPL domain-containing protein [Candidatus Cloacimonetes bacterium]|nr:SIMPL domain-containing protein [Candidatus Cloacimonadota bacterium]MCF7814975.1 SIMPL domain-containing protein [Candidatus Cloacimonadota bacterium]MCF7869333.1 SIMPL domain-containing protein [Candidatus Cloacimonadota bacterium]MCF7884294.1 SIMPL domain-containing protein [Candidatus Cloacimonadota bacterium]
MNFKTAHILAISMIISAIILGSFFYAARMEKETVRVVGYATNDFEADIIKWTFNISVNVGLNELENGYNIIHEKLIKFEKIWKELHIETSDFNVNPVTVNNQFGEYGKITGYNISQRIFLISTNLVEIEKLAVNPASFVEKGITFEFSNIEYFSSKLPEIKQQLLAKATQDARRRAEEIIGVTSSKIKKMKSARAGVFQITEPYSTDVAGYGIYQTSTRNKTIKVTVTAEFVIE